MRVITVIPIGRGMSKDSLTYFTREDIPHGSIVSIPLRSKSAYGLVVGSEPAAQSKSEIKALAFSMKKIERVHARGFLSPAFMQGICDIADYYATTIGAVLFSLIPKAVLEASADLTYMPGPTQASEHTFHETLLLQADLEERYAEYKSVIREEFAKGRSVMYILPTLEDIYNTAELKKGIETYTHVLHSGLSGKEMVAVWKKVMAEKHPVLIIATGSFLSIPRDDIGMIIVEKESSRAYAGVSRPYIDMRTAAKLVAKALRTKLVLGDNLLRVETLWEEKNGTYAELMPLKFRSLAGASSEIVSMRQAKDFNSKEFNLFSPELADMVAAVKKGSARAFLFAGRKGLYPTTVCSDCGTVVACTNCGAPVVLYSKKSGKPETNWNQSKQSPSKTHEANAFVCHHCGERRAADLVCVHCRGWRLTTLGIGTDRVAEEIKKIAPDMPVVVMDKDHVATHRQAVKLRDTFYDMPGGICIGTEMAIPYLNQKIEHAAVVSLDSFFSIPNFRIHEKIFHILLDMRSIVSERLLVQTRQKNTALFDQALKGNLMDFYRDEIEERKQVDYPPFSTLIKLTVRGDKKEARSKMEEIAGRLTPYTVAVFDAFNPGDVYAVHGLITLPRNTWIDPILLGKLRSLPPYVAVKIDPDTLL